MLGLASGALALPFSANASAAPAPVATTGAASSVTFSSAVLSGAVNPRGASTSFTFQYGPTKAYGSQTPLAAAGSGTKSVGVSQAIGGLQPLTVYHYRLVALGAKTAVGGDRSFTTPVIPLSLAIAGVPNPLVFGSPFVVEGNLFGTEGGGRQVALQINPFPYTGGFKQFGNTEVTTATGGFAFPVVGVTENVQMAVVTVTPPLITSGVALETVAVRVSFHARRTSRAGYFHLYGNVTPAEVGAEVGFQLLKPSHTSVNEGGTRVKRESAASGRFSTVIRVPHHGLYRALVKIKDGAHVSSYSAPVLIR